MIYLPCGLIFAPGVSAVAGFKKLRGIPVVFFMSIDVLSLACGQS